jgi:8-oxo-dGTP diphosphatase
MVKRRAVRCAVLRDEAILMVQVCIGRSTWWTLPGGGVEAGESDEQAALRELQEETQLVGRDPRWICDVPEPCFLVVVDDDATPRLDLDPALPDASEIVDVTWRPLDQVADDRQVSCVIAALRSDGPRLFRDPSASSE